MDQMSTASGLVKAMTCNPFHVPA